MKHLLLILPLLLIACKGEEVAQTPAMGMANPASVYCVEQGGTANPETTPQGDISICVLPSGERIEEWALYHRDHPTSTESEAPINVEGEEVVAEPDAQPVQ